jgi:predicted RNA-binding Zn ribbon-like protein
VPATTELRFDTGRTCLDLLATVGSRKSTSPVERLDTTDRLATWLRRTGLVPEDEPLDPDPAWLEAFTSLRGRLHRIIHAGLLGEQPEAHDIDRLNETAAAGQPVLMLIRDRAGVPHRRLASPAQCSQLLASVADDAIRLLSSPDRELMRECEGTTCDLVYLDTSRGHRRRWCSSAACGNRHHVAAHRMRQTVVP